MRGAVCVSWRAIITSVCNWAAHLALLWRLQVNTPMCTYVKIMWHSHAQRCILNTSSGTLPTEHITTKAEAGAGPGPRSMLPDPSINPAMRFTSKTTVTTYRQKDTPLSLSSISVRAWGKLLLKRIKEKNYSLFHVIHLFTLYTCANRVFLQFFNRETLIQFLSLFLGNGCMDHYTCMDIHGFSVGVLMGAVLVMLNSA